MLGLFSCQIGGQINSNQCWALSFSIVNHPPFASSPNKVPTTHFLFLRCGDNVREAAGHLLVDRSGCTSGGNRPLQREHNSQGIPAPHWQPSFFAHAHWGWFSHTQPMPKQTLQLGPSSSLTGLRLYASVAEFDSSSLRRWLVQLIACSVLGHHRFLARFFIVAHPVGTQGFGGQSRNSTPLSVKTIPAALSSVIKADNVDACGSRLQLSRSAIITRRTLIPSAK